MLMGHGTCARAMASVEICRGHHSCAMKHLLRISPVGHVYAHGVCEDCGGGGLYGKLYDEHGTSFWNITFN